MKTIGLTFLDELEAEAPASRKCLERITPDTFEWKPHDKSMKMGYLALMVADMPRWISVGLKDSVIDFGTYSQWYPTSTEDLLKHFDGNMAEVRETLKNARDEKFSEDFSLKNNGQVLFTATQYVNVSSTINHWVHHRGQMTVYMRLKDIPIPSIYGPSADEKTF